MRILLLVFMFVIWQPHDPPAPPWLRLDPVDALLVFASGYMAMILVMWWWGRRVAGGAFRGQSWRGFDRFNRGMTIARLFIPAWFAVGVFCLGWGSLVDRILLPLHRLPLRVPNTALGILPGMLAWAGLWWSQFAVDRSAREQNLLAQIEADLPVFAPPNFRDYFVNKLRTQVLFTVVPVLAIMLIRDAATLAVYETARTHLGKTWGIKPDPSDSFDAVMFTVAVLFTVLISPLLLRRILDTRPLPPSRLRESLATLCRQSNLKCREILLWETHHNTGNAAVMGLLPQVRFVMLSDLLLAGMTDEQIQAVFAHELGHVRHRHLVWIVLFFLLVGGGIFTSADLLGHRLVRGETVGEIYYWASIVVCGGVLLVSYGLLSRWFERQADVYAARTMTTLHTADAAFGAEVFASALNRVAVVNNIPVEAPDLTHGSIQSRVDYIQKLGHDPAVGARFDRTGKRVRIGLLLAIFICAAVLGYAQITGQ